MDTTTFPRPDLRRDIIVDLGIRQMGTAELRHTQVERRIIDEDEGIGLIVQQGLLCNAEITAYLTEVSQHRGKAHESHFTYMLMQSAPGGSHLVAAESRTLCLGVTLFQLLNECSRVQIPGRFTCYEEVFTQFTI